MITHFLKDKAFLKTHVDRTSVLFQERATQQKFCSFSTAANQNSGQKMIDSTRWIRYKIFSCHKNRNHCQKPTDFENIKTNWTNVLLYSSQS